MTALVTVAALAVLAGCLALLCHPLLRFLKVSEVPAALLAASAGLSRRRLAFILRVRRQVYLDDVAGLPPEYLLVVLAWNSAAAWVRRQVVPARKEGPPARPSLPEKRLAPVTAGSVAAANLASAGSVSARGIGSRPVMSFEEALCGDWRDSLPLQSEIHGGHGRFL